MERFTPRQPEALSALEDGALANQVAAALVDGDDFAATANALRVLLEAAEGENPNQTPYVAALYKRLGDGLGHEEAEEIED